MSHVPVVDLTPCRHGSAADRRAVAAALAHACEHVGFATLVGHGVPPELSAAAFEDARDFYALPVEEKMRCVPPPGTMLRGYAPIATQKLARSRGEDTPPDLRENYGVGRPDLTGLEYASRPEVSPFYQPNVWPQRPERFRTTYSAYFACLERLSADLMRLFALGLGLDEHWFDDKIDDHFDVLRPLHYPPQETTAEPGQLRGGAHTDFGTLTLVRPTRAAGGLEVQSLEGRWESVAFVDDAFVMNIGDLMQRWTNDRWRSTLHRVVNPPAGGGEATRRYSIAFFCHPNYDAVVECLPTCLAPGESPRHAPITAGEWMRGRIAAVREGRRDAA